MPNPPSAEDLRAAFAARDPLTVGVEEEVFLLDPGTLDLAPVAVEVLAATGGDPRFKLELPAAQLEIVTPPSATVPETVAALAAGRRDLQAAAQGLVRLAGTAVHPFAAPLGVLTRGGRYDDTAREYGDVARRELVAAFQVHVAVGDADGALPVHDALRSWLPELAALAANGPFHDGRDTGMASIRPKLAEGLPRQGVPPALVDWATYAEALRWGARSGWIPEPRRWWWELRPHPAFGTLEVRVCDTQTTVQDAAAVAAVVQCLVARLVERWAEGRPLASAPTWRIQENRWSANRHGVEGRMADLETGDTEPTRRTLHRLLDDLGPFADRLGCPRELVHAARLVERNGALHQRALATTTGLPGLTAALAEAFTP